jgi:hypothetical protein
MLGRKLGNASRIGFDRCRQALRSATRQLIYSDGHDEETTKGDEYVRAIKNEMTIVFLRDMVWIEVELMIKGGGEFVPDMKNL